MWRLSSPFFKCIAIMYLLSLLFLLCNQPATAATPTVVESDTNSTFMMLDSLLENANRILVGEVLTSRTETTANGISTVASIMVSESIMGDNKLVSDVRVPGGRVDNMGNHVMGAPQLVQGYHVLLFLDDERIVGMGQGAFVVEGGYAWRNTSHDVFSSPTRDRDWVHNIDPSGDYTIYSLSEIREAAENPGRYKKKAAKKARLAKKAAKRKAAKAEAAKAEAAQGPAIEPTAQPAE